MSTSFEARAIYACEKSQDDQLSFEVGDVVHVEDDSDPEWWVATLERTQEKGYVVAEYFEKIAYGVCIFEYTGDEDATCLPIKVGDVVRLVGTPSEEGWWEGEMQQADGTYRRGAFPADFVNVVAKPPKQTPALNNATPTEQPKPEAQPVQPVQPVQPAKPVEVTTPTPAEVPVSTHTEPEHKAVKHHTQPTKAYRMSILTFKKAEALYDYQAEDSEELSLKAGDIISIIDDDPNEPWWEGRLGDNVGFFPRDYVVVVDPNAPPPEPEKDTTVSEASSAEPKKRRDSKAHKVKKDKTGKDKTKKHRELAEKDKTISELNSKVDELLKALGNKGDLQDPQVSVLKTRLESAESQVAQLKHQLSNYERREADLSSQLKQVRADNSALRADVDRLKEEKAALEVEKAELTAQNTQLVAAPPKRISMGPKGPVKGLKKMPGKVGVKKMPPQPPKKPQPPPITLPKPTEHVEQLSPRMGSLPLPLPPKVPKEPEPEPSPNTLPPLPAKSPRPEHVEALSPKLPPRQPPPPAEVPLLDSAPKLPPRNQTQPETTTPNSTAPKLPQRHSLTNSKKFAIVTQSELTGSNDEFESKKLFFEKLAK